MQPNEVKQGWGRLVPTQNPMLHVISCEHGHTCNINRQFACFRGQANHLSLSLSVSQFGDQSSAISHQPCGQPPLTMNAVGFSQTLGFSIPVVLLICASIPQTGKFEGNCGNMRAMLSTYAGVTKETVAQNCPPE